MFKFIYELFCGTNADPVYATDVYPTVGLFTFLLVLIVALVFYLALGRWKPVWDKLIHWVITLIILAGIAIYFALTQAKHATGEDDYDSYMYKFSMINALVAFFYFVLFSLLLKKASIFAKRTPF